MEKTCGILSGDPEKQGELTMMKKLRFPAACLLALCIAVSVLPAASAAGHEHTWGEWTLASAPDCRRTGRRTRECQTCGGRENIQVPRTDHDAGVWQITQQATEFSKGRRTAVCSVCGTTLREEFYPEGTLSRDLENDPAAVRLLQLELKAQGFYDGKATGKYEDTTFSAVRSAQNAWNLDADGIAWPGFLRMLGLPGLAGKAAGEPVMRAAAAHRLQLSAVQTSPRKPYYAAGDQLTYAWTLQNTHPTSKMRDVNLFLFRGRKAVRRTDEQAANEELLVPGDTVSGTFTYTVTAEDAAAGCFSHGFIVRARMGSQAVQSNTVVFVNASAAETVQKPGWNPAAEESLRITASVINQPQNGFFFTQDEAVRCRIEVRNETGTAVHGARLRGSLQEETDIGDLAAGDSWTCDVLYRVTEEDAQKGEVTVSASAFFTENGETKQADAAACSPAGSFTADGLYLYAECISTPANGRYFVPGEKAEFRILVANPSARRTLYAVQVSDPRGEAAAPCRTIPEAAPGTSAVCFLSTEITAADAEKKGMAYSLPATYRTGDGTVLSAQSNVCTVACGPAE